MLEGEIWETLPLAQSQNKIKRDSVIEGSLVAGYNFSSAPGILIDPETPHTHCMQNPHWKLLICHFYWGRAGYTPHRGGAGGDNAAGGGCVCVRNEAETAGETGEQKEHVYPWRVAHHGSKSKIPKIAIFQLNAISSLKKIKTTVVTQPTELE